MFFWQADTFIVTASIANTKAAFNGYGETQPEGIPQDWICRKKSNGFGSGEQSSRLPDASGKFVGLRAERGKPASNAGNTECTASTTVAIWLPFPIALSIKITPVADAEAPDHAGSML
jgi:hypothetical protein